MSAVFTPAAVTSVQASFVAGVFFKMSNPMDSEDSGAECMDKNWTTIDDGLPTQEELDRETEEAMAEYWQLQEERLQQHKELKQPRKWKTSLLRRPAASTEASAAEGDEPVEEPVLKKPAATSVRQKRAAARAEARSTNDLMECYTQRAAKSQKKTVKPPSGASSSDGKDRSGAV